MTNLLKIFLASIVVFAQISAFAQYNLSDLEYTLKIEDIKYIESQNGEVIPAVLLDDGSYHAIPVMSPADVTTMEYLMIAGGTVFLCNIVKGEKVKDENKDKTANNQTKYGPLVTQLVKKVCNYIGLFDNSKDKHTKVDVKQTI